MCVDRALIDDVAYVADDDIVCAAICSVVCVFICNLFLLRCARWVDKDACACGALDWSDNLYARVWGGRVLTAG